MRKELYKKQSEYINLKEEYDKAFKNEQWEKVDELEDDYIEAEYQLMLIINEIIVKNSDLSKEEVEKVHNNAIRFDRIGEMVNLALRLDPLSV